ncbi:MAG: hypothetical protein KGQ59_05875 [Bdellovibrionales bacterium]|nr:hypothetical protein [Bdellovibrionales bacterium]
MTKRFVLVTALLIALVLGAITGSRGLTQSNPETDASVTGSPLEPKTPVKSDTRPAGKEAIPPMNAVMKSSPQNSEIISGSQSDQFRALTRETLNSLVKQEELRKLSSEELHAFPQPLFQSAAALGQIAQKVAKDSTLVPEAIEFYSSCAGSPEVAQSIRALCLARYQHHSRATKGDHQALPAGDIPESVVQLAQRVKLD